MTYHEELLRTWCNLGYRSLATEATAMRDAARYVLSLLDALRAANAEQAQAIERLTNPPHAKPGSWPQACEQRAFVEGAMWSRWVMTGFTPFPSERDDAEKEAVKRYGEPEPATTSAAIISPRLCSRTARAGDVAAFIRDPDELGKVKP